MRDHVVAVQPQTVGQHQPSIDPAAVLLVTVVIEYSVQPLAPQLGVLEPGDQAGVLARDRRLIAVSVERPRLHLAPAQLAAMEHPVKRVLVVVALRPDGAQLVFQLRRGQHCGHNVISMPS